MAETYANKGRFRRVGETARAPITLNVDGETVFAMEGDSLLVAVLANRRSLRTSEFGDGKRAGFCLMGACQDCWMWTSTGERVRGCTTPASSGMSVVTTVAGEDIWPRIA